MWLLAFILAVIHVTNDVKSMALPESTTNAIVIGIAITLTTAVPISAKSAHNVSHSIQHVKNPIDNRYGMKRLLMRVFSVLTEQPGQREHIEIPDLEYTTKQN